MKFFSQPQFDSYSVHPEWDSARIAVVAEEGIETKSLTSKERT